MIIEISRKKAQELGSTEKAIKNGFFTVWNEKRIKQAFNFGNGTKKDFFRYQQSNKQFCIFQDLSEKAINQILSSL